MIDNQLGAKPLLKNQERKGKNEKRDKKGIVGRICAGIVHFLLKARNLVER